MRHVPQNVPLALVIDDDYPRPERDAGSVLAINFVRVLQRLGYHVAFLPTAGRTARSADRARLRQLGVTVLGSRTRPVAAAIREVGPRADLVMLARVDNGGAYYEVARAACTKARICFDTVDLHWVRETREAQMSGDRVGLYRAMAVREREIYLSRLCDATIVVSRAEEEILMESAPGANVFYVPFPYDVKPTTAPFDQRHDICFVGGYAHRPNVDAVEWFLDEIWPRVRADCPMFASWPSGPGCPIRSRHASSRIQVSLRSGLLMTCRTC